MTDTKTDERSPGMFRFYKVVLSLAIAGGFAYASLLSAVDGDARLAALQVLWFLVFYIFGTANVFSLINDANKKEN